MWSIPSFFQSNYVENVPPERFQDKDACKGNKGKRSCSPPTAPSPLSASLTYPRTAGNHPRNAVAFLTPFSARQKHGAGNFAVCGRRPWALPLDPTSIFEKLLDQKTFIDYVHYSRFAPRLSPINPNPSTRSISTMPGKMQSCGSEKRYC